MRVSPGSEHGYVVAEKLREGGGSVALACESPHTNRIPLPTLRAADSALPLRLMPLHAQLPPNPLPL